MKYSLQKLIIFITLVSGITWLLPAQALPAFVRQTDKRCSYCHSAWPQLTAKGREFKELGYRLPSQVDENISLTELLETFPIAGSLVARPADKKDTSDTKIRALHEVEIWLAGAIGRKFSGWAELEAEDEDGFDTVAVNGNVAYHFNRYLNVRAGYASIFWDDPYGFLGAHFNMTGPIRPAFLNDSFGGGEGRLRDSRQMISVYGRGFNNKVFYSLVYGDNTKDLEGEDPRVVMGRLAFDVTDDIHIGGFYMDGAQGSSSTPEELTIINGAPGVTPASFSPGTDFQRYGFDAQIDYQGFRLQGAYVHAQDDLNTGAGNQDNDFFSVQGFYTFKDKSGKPSWVPLIRYDDFEKNDGADSFGVATFQLNYYLTENIKIFGQYFTELNTPAGDKKNDRFTLQLQVAF